MQKHLKKHAFTLWLLCGVILAMLFPGPAADGGFLNAKLLTKIGVWVIFFLQGLSLATSELANGYKPKRLHVFVLTWNYLWFPALVGVLLWPLSMLLPENLRLGFWLLAILPTTVSSAVTFTAVSGGNSSNAIFSTVFSNLLSVLLVPTVCVAYLASETSTQVSLLPLFSTLFSLIVLPLIIGQIIRMLMPLRSSAFAKKTKSVGNWIIIFIVHAAFANSVQSGFLDSLSGGDVVAVILSTVVVLLTISSLVWWTSCLIQPSRGQRIAAFFCASQKIAGNRFCRWRHRYWPQRQESWMRRPF